MKKIMRMAASVILIPGVVLGMVTFSLPNYSAADSTGKKIVLVYLVPKEAFLGKWFNLIYTEAFQRMGLEFEYQQYPGKRCTVLADDGRVDGEVARIATYAEGHPNLIRVEESPLSVEFLALASDQSITVTSWESLRGTDYHIVGMRGVKKLQEKLPGLIKENQLTLVRKWEQGLKMLMSGRADLFIDVNFGAPTLLNTEAFKDSGIQVVGLMEENPTYAYLHKKHHALAPKLAAVLKEMKEEGLIDRYRTMAAAED